jgi:DNA-directed RNA polymerase specialized sigma24 family protein
MPSKDRPGEIVTRLYALRYLWRFGGAVQAGAQKALMGEIFELSRGPLEDYVDLLHRTLGDLSEEDGRDLLAEFYAWLFSGYAREAKWDACFFDTDLKALAFFKRRLAGNLMHRHRDARRDVLVGDDELESGQPLVPPPPAVAADLAVLPVQFRQTMELKVQGYTYQEIARVLNIEVGTAKSRCARARAILRQAANEMIR